MDKANHNHKFIHLELLPRENYQIIYEAGTSGNLSCIHCGEPVKLYLGIQQKPFFYHTSKAFKHECEEYCNRFSSTPSEKSVQEEEHNGFRLPKSRSIGQTSTLKSEWKHVSFLRSPKPFENQLNTTEPTESTLDPSQQKAVSTIAGPLLLLAGAGSGKTRVLTRRTAALIKEHGVDPSTIMLVTFTAKAAQEMKQRLRTQLAANQLNKLVVGTFHSIFYKMIAFHEPNRWQNTNLIKFDWQKEQIIKEAGRKLDIDERDFAFDQAIQQIGLWKNTLTLPEAVKPKDLWEERVLFMYKHYEDEKSNRGSFDFDDMLVGCYQLLKNQPEILARYQQKFQYFLIDEFQDINKIQYEIMNMLAFQSRNICVVGDDDQAIYAFRGSDPSFILNFHKEYTDAKVITLSENYRSTHSIVQSANLVISRNTQRHPKEMKAQYDNSLLPAFFFPYDEEEEATMIVTDLKERIEQGASPSDFAILYRTHTASRALFERLAGSNLPFILEQDAESFYKRKIVKTLIAYLRLSLDPNHSQAISDLLVALFLKKTILNDLKASSILEDCSLVEALKYVKNIQDFQVKKLTRIIPLFKTVARLKPTQAIELIEKEMGFDDFIKKRGNEGNVIEKGSDDVRDLKVAAKKFSTVQDFLEHIDHMIAMNEEMKKLSKHYTNAIQLSTIHRSKGLEYKHVYILSAVDGSLPHDFALDSSRNGDPSPLEEERRLMYVAMTRAQETLQISIPETRRGKTAQPSRFIRTLY
jgi:DNA helicase II / ATP-dependent DNA helicase PcrA